MHLTLNADVAEKLGQNPDEKKQSKIAESGCQRQRLSPEKKKRAVKKKTAETKSTPAAKPKSHAKAEREAHAKRTG